MGASLRSVVSVSRSCCGTLTSHGFTVSDAPFGRVLKLLEAMMGFYMPRSEVDGAIMCILKCLHVVRLIFRLTSKFLPRATFRNPVDRPARTAMVFLGLGKLCRGANIPENCRSVPTAKTRRLTLFRVMALSMWHKAGEEASATSRRCERERGPTGYAKGEDGRGREARGRPK